MTRKEKSIIWQTYCQAAEHYFEQKRIYDEYLEKENPKFPFTPQILNRVLGEYTVMLALIRKLGFEPMDYWAEKCKKED